MRLHQTNLAILIQDAERVSLGLENDTDRLSAVQTLRKRREHRTGYH
jgi:hypothetical protein